MMNTQCGDFDGCGFPSGGRRVLCRLLLGLVSSLASVQAQETAVPSPASSGGVVAEVPPLVQPDAALSFERQVRPLLKTWCLDCHGGE
ncbi:MAG: hypothetical protein ACK5KS_14415, partial [Planctomyces sp.]